MRTKHTVTRIRPRRSHLEVMVEIDYGGSLRWVALKVPWRMLNEQYESVANAMAGEALREMQRTPDPLQDPLPGIG